MFTNNHQLVTDHSIVCNSRLSDHYIIKFSLNIETKPSKSTLKEQNFYKTKLNEYDLFNASDELWSRFNLLMLKTNFDELFLNLTASQMLDAFYEVTVQNVDIIFDKKESLNEKESFTSANKIPRKVRILMRNKSKISKSILISYSGVKIANLKLKLQKIETDLENHYNERRENQEREAILKIKSNPKYFYSYAKRFSRVKSTIGPFIDEGGDIVDDDFKMAEMLRSQYEKAFSVPMESAVVEDPEDFFATDDVNFLEPSLPNIHFSFNDVIDAIDELSANAAPGPDYFPAILLKKAKYTLCHPLAEIFHKSLETGEIPEILRCAYITPLFKSGIKSLPVNYRPVSLTSHISKTFERIIRKSLVAYLEINEKMNPNQHGFRSRRSCLSQLLEHYDRILKILENGENADCIYLDFAKCFDKIDIGLLCQKLKGLKINAKLGIWLHNFLVGRKQHIVVQNQLSKSSSVISGIPQGTVLGPVLALIFLSDLDNNIENIASMFADDTRIIANVEDEEDVENLQGDLDTVYKWADMNNMQFNCGKFELLRYGKNEELKMNTMYFTADNNIVEEKEVLRDLGISMNNKATFDEHISKVCQKVKQKAGWILRTFKTRNPNIMKHLWKQLVQPHVDYCSQLYMPTDGSKLSEIENLQRNFSSKIPSVRHLDYWSRLHHLQLLSQQRRLERYRIIYVWKILEGLVPNCGVETNYHERLGRMCQIPELKKKAPASIKKTERKFLPGSRAQIVQQPSNKDKEFKKLQCGPI